MEKIKVDEKEIIFFTKNAPKGFVSLILEGLAEKGIKTNRMQIHREITTIKKSYAKPVIQEARRLLKAIKGLEFKEHNISQI